MAFSRSGVSTSARTSSSVAARSTIWSADISRMMRVIGVTSAYGFGVRVDEQAVPPKVCICPNG